MNVISQPGITSKTHELSWFQLMDKHTSLDYVKLLNSQPRSIVDSVIHQKDSQGLTLLLKACVKSDAIIVAALLAMGSPYDVQTANGLFAIHIAASKGQPLILELLKCAGMQLNQPDFQGRFVTHYAAEFNHASVLAYLDQCTTDSFHPTAKDNNGLTPLHLACQAGSKQAVQYLLDQFDRSARSLGMINSVLTRDHSNQTCLHSLVSNSSGSPKHSPGHHRASEILWLLLTSLPNYPSHESPLLLVNCVNESNQSAVDLARQFRLAQPTIFLLSLTRWLVLSFDVARVRAYLFYVYTFVWILIAISPLLILAPFALGAFLMDSNWPYILATILILFFSTRQRYRLHDGTNRPNPFFAGAIFSGFISNLLCYSNHLLNLNHASISAIFIFICFTLVVPAFLYVFIKLLCMDPGRARPNPNSSLSGLIQTQLERISCMLDSKCHDPSNPTSQAHLLPFVDLYCPHCNLVSSNQENFVKHCKLCEACFENMDHHCLFISHCVAQSNHRHFILFLILVILFTTLFMGSCLITFFSSFSVFNLDNQISGLEVIQSLFSNFPLSFILILFNVFSWFWAMTLLLDQLNSIVLNEPTRHHVSRPRRPYSRWAWLSQWRAVISFLIHGRRLTTSHANFYL